MKIAFLVSYNAAKNINVIQESEMSLMCDLYELSMSDIIWGLTCKPTSCPLSDMGNLQLFGREKGRLSKV